MEMSLSLVLPSREESTATKATAEETITKVKVHGMNLTRKMMNWAIRLAEYIFLILLDIKTKAR